MLSEISVPESQCQNKKKQKTKNKKVILYIDGAEHNQSPPNQRMTHANMYVVCVHKESCDVWGGVGMGMGWGWRLGVAYATMRKTTARNESAT